MKKIIAVLMLVFSFAVSAQQRDKDYSNIINSKNIYEMDAFLRDAHPDDPRRLVIKPRLIAMMKDYIKNAFPDDQRVKEFQEKIALLKKRPSTKISFEEMSVAIREKQIKKLREDLARANQQIAAGKGDKPLEREDGQSFSYAATPAKQNTTNYGNTNAAATKNTANSAATKTTAGAAVSSANSAEDAEFAMLMNESATEHKNKTVNILNSLFDNDPTTKTCIAMIENKSDCNMIMRIDGVGNTKYRVAIPAHESNSVMVNKGDYLFSSLVCGAQYASQKTVQKSIIVSLSNPGK